MIERKTRIKYTKFGACGNCPPGKEYQPRINLDFFNDLQQIIHVAIALIDRHNTARHPGQKSRMKGIL